LRGKSLRKAIGDYNNICDNIIMIATEFQFNQATGLVIETSQPVIKDEGFVNQVAIVA